jgi:signal transduction histidine kinase
MSLRLFLNSSILLQTIALALSIFNLVAFLWLACTVWLSGNRRSLIARVGVVGLTLSAFFFFIHSLLISGSVVSGAGLVSADFLWRLIWLPALGVPYIWFVIGLHYASLMNERWMRKRPVLLIWSGVLGCSVLILLILNRSTFTFEGTLLLLAYSDVGNGEQLSLFSPLTLLPILFLCYVTFCAIGPWFTPDRVWRLLRFLWQFGTGRRQRGSLRQKLVDTFWDDQEGVGSLDEPVLSWNLARPGLLVAALLMVALTTSLGILGVWTMVPWWRLQQKVPQVSEQGAPHLLLHIPSNLLGLDIFATGAVALIVLLMGYSIMRHGILIERPLARRGFFEQWRGIVIVATTIAIFIAVLLALTRSNLSGLLLITSLATGTYSLFTWSSYTAHDRYIALLKPFLRRTNLRHWLNMDLQKTEQSMEDLFFHLCHDVLEVQYARLVVPNGPVRRSFSFRWPRFDAQKPEELGEEASLLTLNSGSLPVPRYRKHGQIANVDAYRIRLLIHEQPVICWVLPIYDELGLVAKLYLGPRQDGGMFTDEDMDLAHACGQRILDTLRDHEAMLAVSGLLRRRIVDVKLLGAQQRRVLHDEILPHMHLALLHLETLRSTVSASSEQSDQALNEAIETISIAHRRLAAMMRETTTSAPHRLERDGMMHAIQTMIEQDFRQAFDLVKWEVSEETANRIDDLMPPAIAELIFAAVQEVLRNAARHGRGADVHRTLSLSLKASIDPDLEVVVSDDGVGILPGGSSTTGTGGGLLTHSALLAIAGGNLSIKSAPGEGVIVRISLPSESLC